MTIVGTAYVNIHVPIAVRDDDIALESYLSPTVHLHDLRDIPYL